MPSIESLVNGFQKNFDPEKDNKRLYDAFIEISRQLRSSGAGSASGKHYARLTNSAALTIPTATPTPLGFDTERAINGGIHSPSSQNTRITIFRAGLYLITAHVQWPIFAAGIVQLQIQLSGATILASRLDYPQVVPAIQDQFIATGYILNVGDYIEIIANQTSGGNLIIPVQANYSPEAFIGEL